MSQRRQRMNIAIYMATKSPGQVPPRATTALCILMRKIDSPQHVSQRQPVRIWTGSITSPVKTWLETAWSSCSCAPWHGCRLDSLGSEEAEGVCLIFGGHQKTRAELSETEAILDRLKYTACTSYQRLSEVDRAAPNPRDEICLRARRRLSHHSGNQV